MKDAFCTSGTSPTEIQPDFTILIDGSISVLAPRSVSAHAWIADNISKEGFQPWWPTVVIEHRYIANILEGIQADGLAVR